MMSDTVFVAAVLVLVILAQLFDKWGIQKSHDETIDRMMAERRDLLDRIQAPSFAEYAGKVQRDKKSEQPKTDKPEPTVFV